AFYIKCRFFFFFFQAEDGIRDYKVTGVQTCALPICHADRGAVYGMTSSAMFLGNSLGPLMGGAIAASFGLRWVFLLTAAVMAANLVWVYCRVPEYRG